MNYVPRLVNKLTDSIKMYGVGRFAINNLKETPKEIIFIAENLNDLDGTIENGHVVSVTVTICIK